MFTSTTIQAATYFLAVCLFSISFLVFLNASVSFVITDLINDRRHVGNDVGTLGFADELVALVACPVWGVLSDRVGVRTVTPYRSTPFCAELINPPGLHSGVSNSGTFAFPFRPGW